MKTLIIGYGNQSRRDDGVGWFILEQLAALNLPNVELETGHQLEIEAAETISRYDAVIFVDAAIPEAPEPV
jgi:hydrogenase maturation protease